MSHSDDAERRRREEDEARRQKQRREDDERMRKSNEDITNGLLGIPSSATAIAIDIATPGGLF